MTVARRPADMATEPFRPAKRWTTSELCRHTRERHSSEVTPAPPQGWTSEQDQSDTYHLSETGLIATLAVVYGLTSWPHVQTAQQSGSTPTTARKPKSSKDIIGLADAPSDDLRPSSEDTRRIAVIIAEAHRGVPDDGAFIKNVANVGKKGSRRPLERIYPFWLGCPSPISSARC